MTDPFHILRPAAQTLPVVIASPHSGTDYPPAFLADSRLTLDQLRQAEDPFVDRIAAASVDAGIPVIAARYPRVWLDLNREPYELDPEMFRDPLPLYANPRSPRVAMGLGTLPRLVGNGLEIYARPLATADALSRIAKVHVPYHRALRALLDETQARFREALLIDLHSMPSFAAVLVAGSNRHPVDVALGDGYGRSSARALADLAQSVLGEEGLAVARNAPFAGGYTTRHYGQPANRIHALQIELSRSLYMDEAAFAPTTGLDAMAGAIARVATALGEAILDQVARRRAPRPAAL